MSNDKVAATMGGSREDLPYRVQAYALGHAHGKGRSEPSVQDWMCAQHWAKEEQQTTGEHVWEKVAEDDLYADQAAVWQPNRIEYAGPGELQYDPARDAAGVAGSESLQVRQKRSWTPTPVELLVAVSIVLAILVIFCFIVVAY